ncbi:glutathione S-transferase [Moraxella haemolytica]|uniref:glutathione S-transferase n=1 Tax=Moraxella TaxID=475 RepID=UPI0025426D79|nr:glutathione S-transferase [Moraxella sp. ZY171148]WII96111.1 glutathione S-transferase [Moraxella sp. ZY171148]
MLTLHHLNHSRSFRILWLLCELQAVYHTPFNIIVHERNKNFLAPKQMRKIHPMGKAPILVDEARHKTLVESGFIIEYLLKYYDNDCHFLPNEEAWEDYAFWLHFGESSMMPPLVMDLVMTKVATKSPVLIRPVAKAIANKIKHLMIKDSIYDCFSLLNHHLADKDWVAHRFTGADIQVYFAVKALQSRGGLVQFQHLQDYLRRCESRCAYQRAVEQGGELFS